ncbi:hypothetical protein [Photobacterium leiognathi]|uniref:hypothetical protein n=1 Tax=Photobacterium leiognathi TaxID=553611 RepID=UPI00273A389F|nr:hypothetical protein [Photobacterium leiognathi]
MDLDMSDFANLDTSDSQIHEQSTNQLDESKPVDDNSDGEQPAPKLKAKRPRKRKK